jgi:hypothetical protein
MTKTQTEGARPPHIQTTRQTAYQLPQPTVGTIWVQQSGLLWLHCVNFIHAATAIMELSQRHCCHERRMEELVSRSY